MALDEIAADGRDAEERASSRLIPGLRMASAEIAQELGPYIFAGAEEDGIRVLGGFVGQRGDVQASERDEGSLAAVTIGDAISTEGRGDVDLDHNEVGSVVQIELFDMLVNERDFVVRIQIRGERGESEGREERVLDWAKQGTGGFREGGQDEFHFHDEGKYIKYFAM